MAKDTFKNLKPNKKEKVMGVLKKTFQEKSFKEVTVKEIVDELDIARGSFYQYFEDLEDAYFEILNKEVIDIHQVFIRIFQYQYKNLEQALNDYGDELSEILFARENNMFFKNIYLNWDENQSMHWMRANDYREQLLADHEELHGINLEQFHHIKGIIHMIIKRSFKEGWTKEEFIKKYRLHISWILKGVC